MIFINDTATTEIYTLSLHDALPISVEGLQGVDQAKQLHVAEHEPRVGPPPQVHRQAPRPVEDALYLGDVVAVHELLRRRRRDRKSTRLNSSHANISYAVFCLKKKNI